MAKKFSPAPGLILLFERRQMVTITRPLSGTTMEIEDDAPAILVVETPTSSHYFVLSPAGWLPLVDMDVIAPIIDEIDAATQAARAPKL